MPLKMPILLKTCEVGTSRPKAEWTTGQIDLPRFLNGKADKRVRLAESDTMTRFSSLAWVDG